MRVERAFWIFEEGKGEARLDEEALEVWDGAGDSNLSAFAGDFCRCCVGRGDSVSARGWEVWDLRVSRVLCLRGGSVASSKCRPLRGISTRPQQAR